MPAKRGLGFRRDRPRIFEAARASEIDGVYCRRRSIEILRSGLRLGNTGLRSPAWFAGFGPATLAVGRRSPIADSNPSINTHGVGTYKYSRHWPFVRWRRG